MTIPLRDYQIECVDVVVKEYEAGVNRQLIVLPTGSGKTVIMSAIAKRLDRKTLILAHREELINQAVEKIQLFWPDASIGVCKGAKNEIDKQIVVGSIQSCSRANRLAQLQEQGFGLLMVDEAHHAAAESYQNVIESLGFLPGTHGLLVGVTATPQRSDKQGLLSVFDKLVFTRSIATMIKAGYLSPVVGRKILTNLTLDKIKVQNGDFATSELAEAVNTKERNAFIVEKFKAYAENRKTVAFCVDVNHCHNLTEAFKSQGFPAATVWGEMKADDRENVLRDLKTGRIQIVTSCGVLTEGFDEPSINAVVMARPTKSAGLYTQCIGRGLRLWPGKDECLVLDFTDRGHNLDNIITLSKSIPEATNFDEGIVTEQRPIDKTPKVGVAEEVDKLFDILGAARFAWIHLEGNEWSLLDDEGKEILITPKDNGFVAALYSQDGSSRPLVKKPIPLEYCSGICEDFARQNLKTSFADSKAEWMQKTEPPTQGQISYLQSQSAFKDSMTKAQASIEIRKIIARKNKQRRQLSGEPATEKQLNYLRSLGVKSKNMSKLEAMREIAKRKQPTRENHGKEEKPRSDLFSSSSKH